MFTKRRAKKLLHLKKPCAWLMKKIIRCINGAADDLRAQLKIIRKKA